MAMSFRGARGPIGEAPLAEMGKVMWYARLRRAIEDRGFEGLKDEGSALVEMALVLPLTMLMMTGIFSFSLLLFEQIQLVEAVSAAGHYLAVARGAADPCATAIAAIQGQPGLVASKLTITLTQNGTALGTSCPSTPTTSVLVSGATVNVSVKYQSGLAIYWQGSSVFYLNSQMSEIVQ